MKHNMFVNNSIVSTYCLIALFLGVYTEGVAQISLTPLANQPPPNMYSVVTDPTTGDEYACANNVVFKSVNQGGTWTKTANVGMNQLNVLYFSPSGQMYAGGDRTNATPYYGIKKYDKVANTWSIMVGSPQNVTTILEDASSNLYAGTGTTANINPNPINFGTGVYYFNGTTWATANTGMANLTGYSVLPTIKDLKLLSNGDIVAATYGTGVLKYNSGTWSQYGTSLSNLYANCLLINASNLLYVGTDVGVSLLSGSTWATVKNGLPANKPVRALVANSSGHIFAGLGYYMHQKGSTSGEIYYTTNNGSLWQNAGTGFNSTGVVSLAVNGSNIVFAAACGIWQAPSANNWTNGMANISVANSTAQMVQNAQGDWFMMCSNSANTTPASGGVFKSSDKGATWTSINTGINCQKLTVIFVDSHGWLWLGGKQFVGNSPNPAYGNTELYKSSDNGATWTQDLTILNAGASYTEIVEDQLGKLYVGCGFGTANTNVATSLNHAAFDNTVVPPPNNGYYPYGLAVNSLGHIFLGTETNGLMRSTANGAAGSFMPISTSTGTIGNVGVVVDPYTDYIISSGTHGQTNGVQGSKNTWGSTAADNGTNMFPFNNLPDYTSLGATAFDNRGNGYFSINSGNINVGGLHTASFPWTTNTPFTRILAFPSPSTLSYYFVHFMTDDCGYLYGMNQGGGGVYKSNTLVNTPLKSTLTTPLSNATNTSLTLTLNWTPPHCMPDNFRLQIATDAAFTTIIKDQTAIIPTNFTVSAGLLNTATNYYWRVCGINAIGTGKWSSVNSFTTTAVLPLELLRFSGKNTEGGNQLTWQTANEGDVHHFIIEKSSDEVNKFVAIGEIKATGKSNTPPQYYSLFDAHPSNLNYYRLKMVDNIGTFIYSKTIALKDESQSKALIAFYPNPANTVLNVVLNTTHYHTASINLIDLTGKVLLTQSKKDADNQPFNCNIEGFNSGIYTLMVTIDGNKTMHKVVIAK
jgi:hypothetical protein